MQLKMQLATVGDPQLKLSMAAVSFLKEIYIYICKTKLKLFFNNSLVKLITWKTSHYFKKCGELLQFS